MKIWVLSYALPEEGYCTPNVQGVFTNEPEAIEIFNRNMQAEWQSANADEGAMGKYPGDPDKAVRMLEAYYSDSPRDELWGSWKLEECDI